MTRISVGIIFVLLGIVVEGYYNDEYFPEAEKFKRRKGDDYETVVVHERERPHKWWRLRQRSEGLLAEYRRRGYYSSPYRRQRTTYRRYRNDPVRTNVVQNQQTGRGRYEPYAQYTQTHIKGPRTNSRGNEYTGRFVYPQETVSETARRLVNARTDYTDRQDRSREKGNNVNRRRTNSRNRVTEYAQSPRSRSNRQINTTRTPTPTPQTTRATTPYQGCIDTGLYCKFWKSIGCCEQRLGKRFCRKTCGLCSPQQTICPSSYKYGCCFDGQEALDPFKSNCPRCEDRNYRICRRWAVYKDCDLHLKNSLPTRALCPQTCGACFDFFTTA